jgi:hypothetical protein
VNYESGTVLLKQHDWGLKGTPSHVAITLPRRGVRAGCPVRQEMSTPPHVYIYRTSCLRKSKAQKPKKEDFNGDTHFIDEIKDKEAPESCELQVRHELHRGQSWGSTAFTWT